MGKTLVARKRHYDFITNIKDHVWRLAITLIPCVNAGMKCYIIIHNYV